MLSPLISLIIHSKVKHFELYLINDKLEFWCDYVDNAYQLRRNKRFEIEPMYFC